MQVITINPDKTKNVSKFVNFQQLHNLWKYHWNGKYEKYIISLFLQIEVKGKVNLSCDYATQYQKSRSTTMLNEECIFLVLFLFIFSKICVNAADMEGLLLCVVRYVPLYHLWIVRFI